MIKSGDEEVSDWVSGAFIAVVNGNIRLLRKALRRGVKATTVHPGSRKTLLEVVVARNNLPALKSLHEYGADLNEPLDGSGRTALIVSVAVGHTGMTRWLVEEAKIDIDAQDEKGFDALTVALAKGDEKSAHYLMDMEADTRNVFLRAYRKEDMKVLDWLIANGADVNVLLPQGYTPLTEALYNGQFERMVWWIERGADVNFCGGNGPLIKFKGWSPLMLAVFSERYDAAAYLLGCSDIDVNKQSATGINAGILAAQKGALQILVKILSLDGDRRARTHDGNNLLHYAVESGNVDLISFVLVECGLDIDAQNNLGWSPLMLACSLGSPETVDLLLQNGANPALGSKEKNFTALSIAELGKRKSENRDSDRQDSYTEIIELLKIAA